MPKVVAQLAQYRHWLLQDGHRDPVASAYQSTYRLLVEFHELAKRLDCDVDGLGPGILAAAAPDAPRCRSTNNRTC